jgi:hypothetical protein
MRRPRKQHRTAHHQIACLKTARFRIAADPPIAERRMSLRQHNRRSGPPQSRRPRKRHRTARHPIACRKIARCRIAADPPIVERRT